MAAAGSYLVLGTADGMVQVSPLPVGIATGLRAARKTDNAPIFRHRAHPVGTPVEAIKSVVSPAGGIVVVSLSGKCSVIITPVATKPHERRCFVPGTTAITAMFDSTTMLVAGVTHDELWVWEVEHDTEPFRARVGEGAQVAVWIQGVVPPTLFVGRRSGPAELFEFNGKLVRSATVDAVQGVTAALNLPGEGLSSIAAVDGRGALWLCRVDTTTGKLERHLQLKTDLNRITGLAATRGLLGVTGDGQVALWETDGPGKAIIPLQDEFSQVLLLRSRNGNAALAWIDQTGGAKAAGVDLARKDDRGQALRLKSDEPRMAGDLDLLDFATYARPMSILIANRETATPFVMAIDGAWGTGKTSLGRMVDAELPRTSSRIGDEIGCETLWFNAWMHDDAEKLAPAMASVISARLQRLRPWWLRLTSPSPTAVATFARRSTGIVGALAVVAAGLLLVLEPGWLDRAFGRAGIEPGGALLSLGGISLTAGAFRFVGLVRTWYSDALGAFVRASSRTASEGRMAEVRASLGRRIDESAAPIPDPKHRSAFPGLDRLRRVVLDATLPRPLHFVQTLARRGLGVRKERRIVLFIDDLDRCRPERAVEVCETVSQLLDHQRLAVVVMVDLDALAADAEVVFEKLAEHTQPGGTGWGRRFLDKIFQFEFTIPVHRPELLSTLLRDSIGADWSVGPHADTSPATHSTGVGLATLAPIGLKDPGRDPRLWGPASIPDTASALLSGLQLRTPLYRSRNLPEFELVGPAVMFAAGAFVIDSALPRWLKLALSIGIGSIVAAWPLVRFLRKLDSSPGSYEETIAPSPFRFSSRAETEEREGSADAGADPVIDQGGVPASVARREEIRAVLQEGDHLDFGQREAERWLGGSSPRTAKRLANRMLFTLAVATDRELLWTASPLDGQLIGRWVTLIELWPTVAGAIRRDPSIVRRLEAAAATDEEPPRPFIEAVNGLGATGPDVLVLRNMLLATPRLSNHVDALVRLAQ